jgi:hypothetical protein
MLTEHDLPLPWGLANTFKKFAPYWLRTVVDVTKYDPSIISVAFPSYFFLDILSFYIFICKVVLNQVCVITLLPILASDI